MPIPDVYEALQKGVADGMDCQIAQIVNYRLYEVLHYRTKIGISSSTNMSIQMSLNAWNRLSPDLQKEFMSVCGVHGAESFGDANFGAGVTAKFEEAIKQPGNEMEMVELDPGEAEKWREIGKPIIEEWIAGKEAKGLPGQKVYDELMKLREQYK